MKTIPVVLCVDVEPVEREVSGAVPDWSGFEEVTRLLAELRRLAEQRTNMPARFSWYFRMDPQIEHVYGDPEWVARRYHDVIRELERCGDELGLHTHPWRWDTESNRWIIDQGDQRWVEHCVRTSFDAFRGAFGSDCRSFRFGDRWMNDQTMDLLERLGVKFDLTIEPGRYRSPELKELHTGSLPDYRSAPAWPYRPARGDFLKPGKRGARGLWEIPLSTGVLWPSRLPALNHAARAFAINLRPQHETMPLYFSLPPQRFKTIANELLAGWRKVTLVPVLRTDAGASSQCIANIRQNADFLLSHDLSDRFRFVCPAEAVALLQ